MRSSFTVFWLRVVAVVALAIGSSWAARPLEVDHPGAVVLLLRNEAVRQELHLSSLQTALLKSLGGEYRESLRELIEPMPKTREERAAKEKQFQDLNARVNHRALSVLNSSQTKRLREIEHQVLGGTALLRSSVQSTLKLTDKQKQKIEKIGMKEKKTLDKINRKFVENRLDAAERIQQLRMHREREGLSLLKVLTPEQRVAFDQLGGEALSSQPVPSHR